MHIETITRNIPTFAECGGDPSTDRRSGIGYTQELNIHIHDEEDIRQVAAITEVSEADLRSGLAWADGRVGYYQVSDYFVAKVTGNTAHLHWCYYPGAGR